ncbi:hypothetical protein IK112_02550 [Candidatus Saccharibacteria bacterium]|nr:hypothetical protein [Candidatus Saccharibacteria bacterium]
MMRETISSIVAGLAERGYGHLPEDKVSAWVGESIKLSKEYHAGNLPPASEDPAWKKRKDLLLAQTKEAYEKRGNIEDYEEALFSEHLEDPGTIENWELSEVPTSDEMIQFFVNTWHGNTAMSMDYLHDSGKDLRGNMRRAPKDEVWHKMTTFEGMAINEHVAAKSLAAKAREIAATKIAFFGGGNISERLYNLPNAEIINFDTGKMYTLQELFPENFWQREHTTVIPENLLMSAQHMELHDKIDLIGMRGVSMYLGRALMVKALLNAFALLRPGGYMMFNYLLDTASMQRTLFPQHWPKGPRGVMDIFEDPILAITEGQKTLAAVNEEIHKNIPGSFFYAEPNITVNVVEPWGATNVMFTLRKWVD